MAGPFIHKTLLLTSNVVVVVVVVVVVFALFTNLGVVFIVALA